MKDDLSSRRIWKFTLNVESGTLLALPEGAEVLSVQAQRDEVVLWALVDPMHKTVERAFWLFATGEVGFLERHWYKYLGTVQTHGGALVWHAFEEVT